MTPAERAAFDQFMEEHAEGWTIGREKSGSAKAAEWGIAYERKRAAGVARDHRTNCPFLKEPISHCCEAIAAEIEKGEA